MSDISQHIASIRYHIPSHVTLVCVSKFHPADAIMDAYNVGERDFGESRVQELLTKHSSLPRDIRWHMIGHLQTNKVRDIVPFITLIHSVDSLHLLQTIENEAAKINRVVDVLLEVHVAQEQTKSGFLPAELQSLLASNVLATMPHVHVRGIMSMATNTDDEAEIRRCFDEATAIYRSNSQWDILSLGMSDDYQLAIEAGSTMVRIGTDIFGPRQY